MGWAQVDGKSGKGNREDRLVIEPNTTRLVRILLEGNEEPLSVWSHFIPNVTGASKAKGRVVFCPGKSVCPACISDKYRTKLIHVVNVFDIQTKKVMALEAGNQIMKQAKMIKDQYGTFHNINLAIKRDGANKETTYLVLPMPDPTNTAGVPNDVKKLDLLSMYAVTPINKINEWILEMESTLQAPVQNPTLPPAMTPMSTAVQGVIQNLVPPPVNIRPTAAQMIQQPVYSSPATPVEPTPTAPTSMTDAPLTFGKYKGKTLHDLVAIDLDYLKWLSVNGNPEVKELARDLYSEAMINGVKVSTEEDVFIKGLEAEKASETYRKEIAPNVEAGLVTQKVVNGIADTIDMKVARIQVIMERDYKGNFKTVIDKMIDVTRSPVHPNGKMQLGDFDVPELNRLEHALLNK